MAHPTLEPPLWLARRAATYTTHVWRLRAVLTRRLLGEHVGGDTTLELLPDGTVAVHSG